MNNLKCLTVAQPFAWALLFGPKRVENRTWSTSYRGPLAIHAGKSKAWFNPSRKLADGSLYPRPRELVFGAVLGVVDLVDCIEVDIRLLRSWPRALRDDPFAIGPWCWVTANPRPLREPYPLCGVQKLFDAPSELKAIIAQLAAGPLGDPPQEVANE